jgi:hypothetical protein
MSETKATVSLLLCTEAREEGGGGSATVISCHAHNGGGSAIEISCWQAATRIEMSHSEAGEEMQPYRINPTQAVSLKGGVK